MSHFITWIGLWAILNISQKLERGVIYQLLVSNYFVDIKELISISDEYACTNLIVFA